MRFENVEIPVRVEIANPQTHSSLLLAVLAQRDAALQTALGKSAVAIVAKQQAGRSVACDVDVGPAVAVEVGRRRSQRIARLDSGDAGFLADVGERPAPVVMVEPATLLRKPGRTAVN